MKNIYIILVRPQLGQNIGSVARAMKNFGFTNLRIISPRDGWPNERADELAVGAVDILKSAQLYDNLTDATADLNFLYGLTARERFLNKEVIAPEGLASESHINTTSKIGLLFGPENNGLSNEDVSYIDKIITIPTNPNYSSLNIAQSAIITLYELFKIVNPMPDVQNISYEPASGKEITGLFDHLESELATTKFFKVDQKKEGMTINIRSIFKRISNFSSQDVRTLRGIIKALTG